MKNKSCDVIFDLLPLYVDGICSKESRNLVEEHIGECESCKNLLENMKLDINILSKNNMREKSRYNHAPLPRRRCGRQCYGSVAFIFIAGKRSRLCLCR